ncbi:DNA polymerase III subunit gamma and tau [Kytococcus sedentarius]|uniref:DNA polymerase III subunit gamma and tau n=1 Tax=Kytococcus sedentarius TaxID=1276 RepID=UPI0035BBC69A
MSTALYRRYRPQSFSEVVGQEHVTGPLQQALRTGRVNHAYLFSGPRGCGKTTSARILARCLNCEQGPTDTPCGECASCQDLATGGAGSVDVIEIDAASHGGVDDARDLREKASFGPAQSRYKVYIIDEAHMVTSAGFNALLKIVEEPPEHVLFIFATTEPEKVIGTIRSRTHHYPFRLVPPAVLTDYLGQVCEREGIAVEPGVLSYVVRAGGGSVRDSMSVLDQLIAGSDESGITLAGTTALLGFTDSELLDGVVDAYAAGDGASLFTTVERVVESGQDPRRFVEDLSERMRDLILVNAVPTGTEAVLPGVPSDQLDRLRVQAGGLGPAELSRASDVLFHGLAEMTGATSPRLQLEIIMARLLLPRAAGEGGFAARLEKVERWMAFRGDNAGAGAGVPEAPQQAVPQQQAAPAVPGAQASEQPEPSQQAVPEPSRQPSEQAQQPQHSAPSPEREEGPGNAPAPEREPAPEEPPADMWEAEEAEAAAGPDPAGAQQAADVQKSPGQPQQPPSEPTAPAAQPPAPEQSASPGAAPVPLETLRHEWPTVLDKLKDISRVTWALVSQSMQVQDLSAEGLTLATEVAPIAERFSRGENADRVAAAVQEALGFRPRVRCVVGGRGAGGQGGAGGPQGGPGGPGGSGGAGGPRSGNGGAGGAAGPGPQGGPGGPGGPADTSGGPGAPSSASGGRGFSAAPGASGGAPAAGGPGAVAGLPSQPDPVGSPAWGQRTDDAPDWATGDLPDAASGANAPGNTPDTPAPGASGEGAPGGAVPGGEAPAPAPEGGAGAGPDVSEATPEEDAAEFTPDLDDETVESVGMVGTAAIEKILGGTVIEEHSDQA